ncbi:hypothetical protein DMENIID0001_108150 [Sergentomyia squamirostris]
MERTRSAQIAHYSRNVCDSLASMLDITFVKSQSVSLSLAREVDIIGNRIFATDNDILPSILPFLLLSRTRYHRHLVRESLRMRGV